MRTITGMQPLPIEVPPPIGETDIAPRVQLVDEIATWLETLNRTQAEPEHPLRWCLSWDRPGVVLRGPQHLAVLVSTMPDESYGGVEGPVQGRWVQTMRVGDRWILEVCHESLDWPRRVYAGDQAAWPGKRPATSHLWGVELFRSLQVADVGWAWMRKGHLPAGFSHTLDYPHGGRR